MSLSREEIIRMARETGKTNWYGTKPDGTKDFLGAEFTPEQLEHFAVLVAAAEREACAQIGEAFDKERPQSNYGRCLAVAIRARGNRGEK